jgi:asparagine synthase (glutamine-hydrolysing)
MPGLVGFVGEPQHGNVLLSQMVNALLDEPWYEASLEQRSNFGLGRISLNYLDNAPQPIWNENQTICLALEGEIFGADSLRQQLLAAGHFFRSDNMAEFVLRLYEACGEDFVADLNGAFTVAIWDGRSQKLIIANDRLGLHPLYYTCHNGDFLFASGVRALLADPRLPRQIDAAAVAQFLTFDYLLNDHTLLTAVKLLRPASLLSFQEGQLNIRPYWTMRYAEHNRPISEEVYLEELIYYLRQAARRQASGSEPATILLSGGLDSRILLGFLTEDSISQQLGAYTFGIPGCDDGRFAQELARKRGVPHQFFELKADYLIGLAPKAVRLTDGMQNCVHMHALATLSEAVQKSCILYKGFLGDALMGYSVNRIFWAHYDVSNQPHIHFQTHLTQNYILFNLSEHERLFTPQFQSLLKESVFDQYRNAFEQSGATSMADQRNYFDIRQRNVRMISHGVELVRSRGIVRLPFCDNDLLDFSLSVPPGLRFERYLVKKALVHAFPELAKVPYTGTGYPLMPCLRNTFMQLLRQVRWRLRDAGLRWIPPAKKSRPYADYQAWFRTVLRGWVEDILLDRQTLERGYFEPAYIAKLVAEHMAGSDHASRLGALISLELWHRQFLD